MSKKDRQVVCDQVLVKLAVTAELALVSLLQEGEDACIPFEGVLMTGQPHSRYSVLAKQEPSSSEKMPPTLARLTAAATSCS